MVVNAAQLATYSQAKEFLISSGTDLNDVLGLVLSICYCISFPTGYVRDGIGCHFASSLLSGFVTTVVSMPVDITKTRYV